MGERISETIIFLSYGCLVFMGGYFAYFLDMALFRIYFTGFSILTIFIIFGFILIELTAKKNQIRIYDVQVFEQLQRMKNSKTR